MRLYLDDVRPTGQGSKDPNFDFRAYNCQEAIRCIKATKTVTHISFDHDLGQNLNPSETEETGYTLATWIENNILDGEFLRRMTWEIHSANPVGANRIRMAMESCDRLWTRMEAMQRSYWLDLQAQSK